MSEHDEAATLARLQAALDRIAASAETGPEPAPDPRLDEARERLDRVIARLRGVLRDE